MKSNTIKIIGTIASVIIAGGGILVPLPYRDIALAISGMILTALHIPRPGDIATSDIEIKADK